jgi:glycerophosphoryl diester phosphodiesterase
MTQWISHRGVRVGATEENTKQAFAEAVYRGFGILETDLRLTADHAIVLCHDPDFSRVISGEHRPIIKLTRSQIESLRYRDGSSPYFFDEFTQDFSHHHWVLDIKPETSFATLRLLKKHADSVGLGDFCQKASLVVWSKQDKDYAIKSFPGIKIYATESECWRAGLCHLFLLGFMSGIKPGVTYSVSPSVFGIDLFKPWLVKRYHKRQARILAFLPSSKASCIQAKKAGFDEILSDGWISR